MGTHRHPHRAADAPGGAGGKLSLVLEKSLVDLQSPAFQVVKALREKWLGATGEPEDYRRPGPIRFSGKTEEDRPMTLVLNALAG